MRFALPIRCTPGQDCFIQNYVDRDNGPGKLDYHCGSLTYDGHTGTDFRLRDLAAMQRGYAVIAAAPGRVVASRDGEPDMLLAERGKENIKGREAGNGVRIDHGKGWETQYSHLKKGSVVVHPGDWVETGQRLGDVGLSGQTEFPHVDFTLRKDGQRLDPFARYPDETLDTPPRCDHTNTPEEGLWLAETARQLSYQATGLLNEGFATEAPTPYKAQQGDYHSPRLSTNSPMLVYWFEAFGLQKDDEVILSLAYQQKVFAEKRNIVSKPLAVAFAFTGGNRPQQGWPAGEYQGQIRILRAGKLLIQQQRVLNLP